MILTKQNHDLRKDTWEHWSQGCQTCTKGTETLCFLRADCTKFGGLYSVRFTVRSGSLLYEKLYFLRTSNFLVFGRINSLIVMKNASKIYLAFLLSGFLFYQYCLLPKVRMPTAMKTRKTLRQLLCNAGNNLCHQGTQFFCCL